MSQHRVRRALKTGQRHVIVTGHLVRFRLYGTVAPLNIERAQWAQKFMAALKDQADTNNLVSSVAWAMAEGGGVATENIAHYNAINTTQPMPHSHPINSVGVQSYDSAASGLAAIIKTITNGYYAKILACFKASSNPTVTAATIGSEPWGTNGALVARCIPLAQAAVAALPKPTPPPAPKPTPEPTVPKVADTYAAKTGMVRIDISEARSAIAAGISYYVWQKGAMAGSRKSAIPTDRVLFAFSKNLDSKHIPHAGA